MKNTWEFYQNSNQSSKTISTMLDQFITIWIVLIFHLKNCFCENPDLLQNILKLGHSQPLFRYFCHFNSRQGTNVLYKSMPMTGVRMVHLWYRNQPLCH